MIVRIMNYEEEEDGGGWRVEKVCRGHNVETADNKIHSSRINTYAHCSPSPCPANLWVVAGSWYLVCKKNLEGVDIEYQIRNTTCIVLK